ATTGTHVAKAGSPCPRSTPGASSRSTAPWCSPPPTAPSAASSPTHTRGSPSRHVTTRRVVAASVRRLGEVSASLCADSVVADGEPDAECQQDRAGHGLEAAAYGGPAEPPVRPSHAERQDAVHAALDRYLEHTEHRGGREQRPVVRDELRVEREQEHGGLRVGHLDD